ncbi:MAG: TRAP transporter solute receptor, TAXI family [Synergistales bacterium 53_16]|jgi:hypothetical protein|nr:MAG: TRAP transporter solute receptor, TAXI family [Synergistales bacterium 53_16]MDN5335248.1 uncharacterized protein [Synergistales bacterium]HAG21909.1 C4-dicarboxylate ABC transporter substrate-binding protein [Synergistaceae bacterium]
MRKVLILAMALLVAFSGAALAAEADWPPQIRFMAGPPGGNWFALGGTLADMWTQNVVPTTSGTGGGVSNIINVDRGRGELALSVTSVLGAGQAGEAPFQAPMKNAKLFANLYRQYTYFIMRKDYAEANGISTIGDIVEKKLPIRMATLKPGTSSEFVISAIFKRGFDVSWDDIKDWGGSVEYASYDDGANLLADNHIDMFAFAVGRAASVVMKIESQTDIVILPVDEKAREVMKNSLGTTTFNVDKNVYKSVTGDVPVVGDYTCIIVRGDLPDDLVYSMAKSLWENKDDLAKSIKDIGELNPAEAISEGVDAHPGAVKFWNEVK